MFVYIYLVAVSHQYDVMLIFLTLNLTLQQAFLLSFPLVILVACDEAKDMVSYAVLCRSFPF